MSVGFWLSYGVLWALVALLTLVVLGMLRTNYSERADDAPGEAPPNGVSTRAPSVSGIDLTGREFVSDGWGTRTALLFVSPDCLSCKVTLPELSALSRKVHGNLVVICRGVSGRCAQMAEHYDLDVRVIPDEADAIAESFGVTLSPTAVLVSAGGDVEAFGSPLSGEDLERLIIRRREESEQKANGSL